MNGRLPVCNVDWETALEAVGGDHELLDEIVDAFVSDAPRQYESLKGALRSADAATVRRAAHTLKGNGRYFGAHQVVELAQTIEELAHRGELTGLDEITKNLGEALEKVLAILVDYANTEGGTNRADHLDRG